MYGQELAEAIAKRRGDKPNPGTIYPALNDLRQRGLIRVQQTGRKRTYELTSQGRAGLSEAVDYFTRAFGDIVRTSAASRRA